ncbi:unnamed protein product [Protopolystoma xenopodis]|uniref:Uncharacterized protein n=1 Tax=Protopolystoma xenopodis TaxID=117903 RepID=A0A448WX97_9PLAT|nr:unnamed protein product [Protopolystoma xenopodis]
MLPQSLSVAKASAGPDCLDTTFLLLVLLITVSQRLVDMVLSVPPAKRELKFVEAPSLLPEQCRQQLQSVLPTGLPCRREKVEVTMRLLIQPLAVVQFTKSSCEDVDASTCYAGT